MYVFFFVSTSSVRLKLYVEHSNEVWNFGFKQFSINTAMAEWEVLNGTKRYVHLWTGIVSKLG